jgi:hypothetical protein
VKWPVRAVPVRVVVPRLGGGWKVRRSAEDHCKDGVMADGVPSGGEVSDACTGAFEVAVSHGTESGRVDPAHGETRGPPPFVLPSYLGRMTVRPVHRALGSSCGRNLDVVLGQVDGPVLRRGRSARGCGRGTAKLHRLLVVHSRVCWLIRNQVWSTTNRARLSRSSHPQGETGVQASVALRSRGAPRRNRSRQSPFLPG